MKQWKINTMSKFVQFLKNGRSWWIMTNSTACHLVLYVDGPSSKDHSGIHSRMGHGGTALFWYCCCNRSRNPDCCGNCKQISFCFLANPVYWASRAWLWRCRWPERPYRLQNCRLLWQTSPNKLPILYKSLWNQVLNQNKFIMARYQTNFDCFKQLDFDFQDVIQSNRLVLKHCVTFIYIDDYHSSHVRHRHNPLRLILGLKVQGEQLVESKISQPN